MAIGFLLIVKDVAVSDIASVFPTVEGLAARVYMVHETGEGETCEYFEYVTRSFTSIPTDQFCRVFDFDDRHPGEGEGVDPIGFTQDARDDLAGLKAAFRQAGLDIEYLNVVFRPDGSVGPGSFFQFDPCVAFVYEPGWSVLPEDFPGDSTSVGIDANWYKMDSCL